MPHHGVGHHESKLVRHCADRPRGVLCALDEMASWAGKLVDPRSGEDKSAWTVAYEGHRYEMDRVGAGTILAENYSVAIFGNIQPRCCASRCRHSPRMV